MENKIRRVAVLASMMMSISCLSSYGGDLVKGSGTLQEALHGQSVFEIVGSRNLNGEIQILSRQGENVVISYEKSARASSETESARFLELIDFKLTIQEDRAIFRILSPAHAPWQGSDYSVHAKILIELPEKMTIEGDSDFMKFQIDGPFQGVDLRSTYSSMDIRRIYGPVEAITTFADVNLDAIKGEVRIETQNGKISASDMIIPTGYAVLQATHGPIKIVDIKGSVEAYTSYSDITARNIEASEGSVVLRTSYGSLNVEQITGELICETSYAPINVVGLDLNHGHSRIETSHSAVTVALSRLSGSELYVANNYSNVNLSIPESSSVKLIAGVGNGGAIYTSNIHLRPTVLDNTRLEGIVGDGESRIEIDVSGIGNINIDGQ